MGQEDKFMDCEIPLKLPIIDFCKEKLKPGTSYWDSTSTEIRRALEDYGCFEAVYDSVTLDLHNSIFSVLEDLMNLPMETKCRNIIPGKPFFGYFGNNPLFLYESMGINDAHTFEAIQNFTNLMWPQGNANYCEILHSYSIRLMELEKMVKKMIFQSLGVEKYYNSHVESTGYRLRLMKYEAPKNNETKLGVNSHTDKTFISILHQNHVNGLEVQTKYGQWIQVTPAAASSFIVMTGDLFFAWCNGRLHCPPHKVLMSGNEARYSIGFFASSDEIVQSPEELVDEQHPLLFKPFDPIGLLNFQFTEEGQKAESCLKAYCGV